jgi:hypothetical protein
MKLEMKMEMKLVKNLSKLMPNKSPIEKMKTVLEETQVLIRNVNFEYSMSLYQKGLIPKTATFISFSETYLSEGLTQWGGLLKYCDNALNVILEGMNKFEPPVPIVLHIGEKMSHVVNIIANTPLVEKLNEKELVLLESAKIKSDLWLSHTNRAEMVKKIESIIEKMDDDISRDGLINAMKKGSEQLKPLLQW